MTSTTAMTQPSSTNNVILEYERGIPCEFCGSIRPLRLIPLVTSKERTMPMGYAPCSCSESREALAERAENEKRAELDAQKQAEEEALVRAGIPQRYLNAAHPWAERMADLARLGQSFFIYGDNGTYKTTLAMAAGILLVKSKKSVLAVSTYDLMDSMRSRKTEDRTLFDRAASVDVLILDDLGKEASNTAYACERLFAIIDKRDKAMMPVIVTSNYQLDEIAHNITEGAIGVAIASRLRGSCKQLPLNGEDRRIPRGQD